MLKNTKEIGSNGEDVACKWLKNKGFLIIERNYNRKWGEIDIIAAKDKMIHFIEVKSVTLKKNNEKMEYRPEENVHNLKVRRLKRVIQTYLVERRYLEDVEFRFHVVMVYMNEATKRARVEWMENIIL